MMILVLADRLLGLKIYPKVASGFGRTRDLPRRYASLFPALVDAVCRRLEFL